MFRGFRSKTKTTENDAGSVKEEPSREAPKLRGDNPIRRPEDDKLERGDVAQSFARQVLALDASEGVVVGVLGAWGSGKTSFVNLSRGEFDRTGVPVLEFNPWMFSGAEQLVGSFFTELAAQLKIRPDLAKVGQELQDYGDVFSGMVWLPFVGPWIERGRGALKILAKIMQSRKEGVGRRRAELEKALRKLKKPILVFLDDIDRLSTSEIRDIFKLVRLTASFPNIIYVLAFDRPRVEQALAEQGVPGRAYLEKILQLAFDLPSIPEQVLSKQILSAMDDALTGIENPGPFDDKVWPDFFSELVRPLIRNMRDVRRYAAAIRGTVESLDGQIALADIFGVEAIRVFLPDTFAQLRGAVEGLTTPSSFGYGHSGESQALKKQIDNLITADPEHADVVRAMITRLFPAGQRHIGGSHYRDDWKASWLKERRIAHEDILRFYLERIAGEGLRAFSDAEKAWAKFADGHALDNYLRSLDKGLLQDVIAALETYEDQFSAEHVVSGAIVLLNLLPDLPERKRGMLEFDARLVVGRVVYRLVRSLKDSAAIESAVRQILPEVKSLSSKLELITEVGYQEGAGHKLVSEGAASQFETSWGNEVRAAPAKQLVEEFDLLRVLLLAKRDALSAKAQFVMDSSPELTLALLRSAWGEILSQPFSSRAVSRRPQLAWEALVELYGDESTLRQRIETLKATKPDGADELLKLADKYVGGWRPNRFGKD